MQPMTPRDFDFEATRVLSSGLYRGVAARGIFALSVLRESLTHERPDTVRPICPRGVGFAHEWLDICSPLRLRERHRGRALYMGSWLILGFRHPSHGTWFRGATRVGAACLMCPLLLLPGLSLLMAFLVLIRPEGRTMTQGHAVTRGEQAGAAEGIPRTQ